MARVPLVFPKIPGSKDAPLARCVAFEKYDGTNLHWVWEPELGWYGFGTRRHRFDLDEIGIREFSEQHPELSEAPSVFLDTLKPQLEAIMEAESWHRHKEITVFTEFLGDSSFAGRHKSSDKKRLVVIEAKLDEQFLDPEKFLHCFAATEHARVIYRGKLTGTFMEKVRAGEFDVYEGVVCKGVDKAGRLWRVKIKTRRYMTELKQKFADSWEQYWE